MPVETSLHEQATDQRIGAKVRDRREAVGVTQARLGDAIGVTFQQVQKYEKGANRISASKLLLIANTLRCDVAELYGEETDDAPGAASLVRSWSKLRPDQREAIARMIDTLVA